MKPLLFFFFALYVFSLNAQVGIGTTDPAPSSILDLTSTDKALLLPRVTNTAAISTPVDGMLIYDVSSTCIKTYENGAWSDCFTNSSSSFIGTISALDCGSGVFNPTIGISGVAYSGSITVSYTGGDGKYYVGESVSSTGVTGLTAIRNAGAFLFGAGSVAYTITGTPSAVGTASFAINLGGQSCTINLTVIDDAIAAELSGASLIDYLSASTGEWVAVTGSEYDAIATNLMAVSRFGTAEANMFTGVNGNLNGGNMITFGQTNNPSLTNSYIFAFKVAASTAISSTSNDQVRLSLVNNGTGFNAYGNTLPDNTASGGEQHFVLKSANTLHTNPMYLGLSLVENNPMYYNADGTTGGWFNGSVTAVANFGFNFGMSMQGLSTTSKQWQ